MSEDVGHSKRGVRLGDALGVGRLLLACHLPSLCCEVHRGATSLQKDRGASDHGVG